MSANFNFLYIKQVFFNNTDIYFNNFLQCDYNCNKVKQILNLYSLFNYMRNYQSISKKTLNYNKIKNNKENVINCNNLKQNKISLT